MTNDRYVAVVGMHRSGTSVLARMINLLGADLGPEDALMAAHAEDNPMGYWEHQPMVDLNDRILAHFGSRWDSPPQLRPGWEHDPDLDDLRRCAMELIDTAFAGRGLVAWKDPRLSLLLPFWRTVVSITATVMAVRHPFEVANSLGRRDDIPSETAADLWSRHVIGAWSAHPHRAVLSYDTMLEQPEICATRLALFLDLAEPDDSVRQAIRAHMKPELRRSVGSEPPVGPRMALALALHTVVETQEFAMVDAIVEAVHGAWGGHELVGAVV